MVMPGNDARYGANSFTRPPPPCLIPKRRHLGGDLLCVQGPEIEAKRKDEEEEKEIVTPRRPDRGGRTPNRGALSDPLGHARLVPKKQNTLHVHTTQFSPMRRRSVHTHTYIRRAAFEVAPPPLLRTPSVVHARISGDNGVVRGWCPRRLRFSQGRRFTRTTTHCAFRRTQLIAGCGPGTYKHIGPGENYPAQTTDEKPGKMGQIPAHKRGD